MPVTALVTPGPLITIEFEGEGFLYKMVRIMVGVLVQIGSGTGAPNEIRDRLRGVRKSFSTTSRSVAPAAGLFLVRVRY